MKCYIKNHNFFNFQYWRHRCQFYLQRRGIFLKKMLGVPENFIETIPKMQHLID